MVLGIRDRDCDCAYCVTVTVTSCALERPPSWAITRTTYVPGALNVTATGNLPFGGSGGGRQPGDPGEGVWRRESGEVVNSGGGGARLASCDPREQIRRS